mmetsp:Transcript_3468/g.6492  ORF Transcript_3468/g.6492 Transcript_3468/m.6492 type:complete len:771 (+) Transcript_3468:250-2562(+)|eukprot:CAMPEP_0114247560 /NCGR_PEP_ID=MMETSP0058-20121206/13088_1 /TAXON_ID=36894 /ORGANISM="Pyramimonas parkeae, CCMP726" /LENGTH=770 /DNA_ID=CAMNT_0001360875 /DNA_START=177 /DNA_END=2489 /DNA_ORIENTATION=+
MLSPSTIIWRKMIPQKCAYSCWSLQVHVQERRTRSLQTTPTTSCSKKSGQCGSGSRSVTEFQSYPQYAHYSKSSPNFQGKKSSPSLGRLAASPEEDEPSSPASSSWKCNSEDDDENHPHAHRLHKRLQPDTLSPQATSKRMPSEYVSHGSSKDKWGGEELEQNEYNRIKTCFWRLDGVGRAVAPDDTTRQQNWDQGTLEQVVVLCRHGVRLPEHSFPNFTLFPLNQKWWTKFGGQLTPVGVEQMRRIGERLGWYYAPTLRPSIGQSVFDAASGFHSAWEALTDPFHAGAQPRSALHERFRSLIAPVKEKVEVISSGYTRAVFTAQSVMLGLFPDVPLGFFDDADPEDKVYFSVRESQLAVHLLGMDCAFAMGHNQRKEYSGLKQRFFASSQVVEGWNRDARCEALVDKAWRMTQHKYFCPKNPIHRRLEALVLLQQQMEIENALHMPVFANECGLRFTLEEETLLKELTSYMHHLKFEGHNVHDQLAMGRAAGGGTLHIISNFMHKRVKALERGFEDPDDASEAKQLVLLSAHDQTIMAVLSYLRIRDWPYPQLGATVMFELRKLEGKYIVQIKYNDDPKRRLMSSCRPIAAPVTASGPQQVMAYDDIPVGAVPFMDFDKCFNIGEKWFESSKELLRLSIQEPNSKLDHREVQKWLKEYDAVEMPRPRSRQMITADLKEAFDYFDKDGNGSINKAELGAMLRMLGNNLANDDLDYIVKCNDKDGNGLLCFEEFQEVSTQFMLLQTSKRRPLGVANRIMHSQQPYEQQASL